MNIGLPPGGDQAKCCVGGRSWEPRCESGCWENPGCSTRGESGAGVWAWGRCLGSWVAPPWDHREGSSVGCTWKLKEENNKYCHNRKYMIFYCLQIKNIVNEEDYLLVLQITLWEKMKLGYWWSFFNLHTHKNWRVFLHKQSEENTTNTQWICLWRSPDLWTAHADKQPMTEQTWQNRPTNSL